MTGSQSKTPGPRSRIATWTMAARPKTLWAAMVPVFIGTAMAYEARAAHWPSAAFALIGAVLIQIGTNFSNDFLDYKKGADSTSRKGPTRVTQAGLIPPKTMERATFVVFTLAFIAGLYLVFRGGWPVLLIGVLSITAGVLYTAGRYSLAYLGLGDLAVLIFFGPVAVGGTYYVQALSINAPVIIAGLAPGLLSVAILLINNIRDVKEDRQADKKTIVVRLGRSAGIGLYVFVVVAAALIPVGLYLLTGDHPWAMTALGILPLAYPTVRKLTSTREARALNPLLGATARLLLFYGITFSLGWIV